MWLVTEKGGLVGDSTRKQRASEWVAKQWKSPTIWLNCENICIEPMACFLRYAIAFLDRMLNSLRFFVRCGSRWRAGTQLGLTELRRWTTCTMIVPAWNHDLTSQTSSRFRWLHYQSSHILEKARNQNWHLSVIYNDKGYASKALNGLCPTRTDNFCWITSLPILTQGILILFRDQSALHGARPTLVCTCRYWIRSRLSCRPETANQIRIYVFI